MTQEEIIKIFEENSLEEIVEKYKKKELIEMYKTFYSSNPLSASDKMRIAQNIYHYIYTMKRTRALLG